MKLRLSLLGVVLLGSACLSQDDGGTTAVVVTTSIWGEVAEWIVGDDGELTVLMPVGADAHDFQMSSSQAALVAAADLVVANGLGLEEGMEDGLQAAVAAGANLLELGDHLDPIALEDSEHGFDPHVWMDPVRVSGAAELIAQRLADVRPEVDWTSRAELLTARMLAIDLEIGEILAVVPPTDRKLVTNHEALGYFADRYGFQVIGSVIPGPSTLDQPSSAELAELVATMRDAGVNVIFAETVDSSALAEAVAAELGEEARVVQLFTESLGPPGTGADTVAGMLLTNARLIADALTG